MDIVIVADYQELSEIAAGYVIAHMKKKPRTVLGLPTGSTPEGLYSRLVEEHRKGGLDFSTVTTFNLDEYLGLGPDHEQSYRHYMQKRLFGRININEEHTHIPDGLARDTDRCCRDYEHLIESVGGIDLQVLGIGRDGHIGFNEPGGSLASRTRVVVLAPETVEDNSRFFSSVDEVPQLAVSMGLGTISDARRCVLLACGEQKAEAIEQSVEGPVTAMVPASVLQMHPETTLIVDEAAASRLRRKNYYRAVQEKREHIAQIN